MRQFLLLGALTTVLSASPAWAMTVSPTPKETILKLDVAERRIQAFLKTLKNLPPDVLVMPATGIVPWPGVKVSEHVRAEVWTAVAGNDPGARPFVMFAVRPDTGEVYVLYLRQLEPEAATKP